MHLNLFFSLMSNEIKVLKKERNRTGIGYLDDGTM
jgi:uncharacterized protein YacL